jgi:hypothetical protein
VQSFLNAEWSPPNTRKDAKEKKEIINHRGTEVQLLFTLANACVA